MSVVDHCIMYFAVKMLSFVGLLFCNNMMMS